MEKSSSVEVLEVCQVAPTPVTTTEVSLPLNFFDLVWLRFPPTECLLFFEFPHPPSSFDSIILSKLKRSLSLTLYHFLPLAGKITWPPHSPIPRIHSVHGVSLTIAESNADFNHLSSSDFSDAEEHRLLVPHLTVSDEEAFTMSLQITQFPNSGFSIGITTHHAAADGKSVTSFIKSWAYVCFNLGESSSTSSLPENLKPAFDRSVIKEPSGLAEIFANFWLKQGGPNSKSLMVQDRRKTNQGNLVWGTFEMIPSNIEKLKKVAESKLAKKIHISTFSVTCAYVLDCLIKVQQIKQEKFVFIFGADCRSRLDPPIPPTYFGNCIGGPKFVAETKSLLGNDGFIVAVEGISEALKSFEDGVLSGAERWISEMEDFAKSHRIFSASWSPRFEVYGNNFGWGRPKKVEIVSIDQTGAFSLLESKNGNGAIEIALVLSKPEMKEFSARYHNGLSSP